MGTNDSPIYVFLIPQSNDRDTNNLPIFSDLVSTLNAIKANNGIVNTYQTCIKYLKSIIEDTRQLWVILADSRMVNVSNYSVSDIVELENMAYEDLLQIPEEQLKQQCYENAIRNNSLDFYQSLYCDNNKEELEESMVQVITHTKEENKDVIDNELAVIDKIMTAYNIQGTISKIVCNDNEVNQQEFLHILEKIKLEGFSVPGGYVSFHDTKEMNYYIEFTSGTKIVREFLDFSVVNVENDVE